MRTKIRSFKSFALMVGVCTSALLMPMQNASAENFSPEQVKELKAMFKDFIMENPDVILESVDKFRSSQDQKTQASAQENLEKYKEYFASDNLPMAGNPEGDITVVEFLDYNCGYCRKAFEDIQTLLKDDKNVRIIFQEMPILSPVSRKMAIMAMAAHKQGKYFEMHSALMNHKGSQSDEAFNDLAAKIGLDLEQLKKDMSSQLVEKEVDMAISLGRDLGIRGTPGFVIGDKIYPGYIGLDGLRKAIEDGRSAAK